MTTACWAVRLQAWHPWFILKTSLVLRKTVTRGPCFFTFTVTNQFRYLVWGQEPSSIGWWTHDRPRNKYSVWLITGWNKWSCSEMPYYFSCFVSRFFYRPVSCLFLYTKLTLKLGISSSAHVLGNVWLHSVASNDPIVCNGMQSHLLSFFLNLPSLKVHSTNRNVKQAWKNLYTIGIYQIKTVGAQSLLVVMYPKSLHKASLFRLQ